MGKIDFGFHATNGEVIEVVKNSILEYNLYLVAIQLFPQFSCRIISKEELNQKRDIIKDNSMILLYNYKPNLLVKNSKEFWEKNKECLIFEIGMQKNEELKESRISSITENKDTLKVWKDILKGFKGTMLKGAWVINPNNGAKEYCKNHCYTLSAKELFQKGIKITPYAGWNEYILNEEII